MKYKFGSNYGPSKIAMPKKEKEKNREVIGITDNDVDDSGNAIHEYDLKHK